MARAAQASYPSHWAADSAVRHYGADRSRIAVIPWGANLPREIAEEEVAAAIARRPFDRCELVFIGRDWRRKGGDTLAATVAELNRTGMKTHATIIGCKPTNLPRDEFTTHRFLNKADPEHFAALAKIMLKAHFLFVPSRAEAYGQVFCEAIAFGVPVIGTTVGGIPTIVREGETGFLRPPDAPAAEFASLIRNSLSSPVRYREMARSAREDYRARLNWDVFGRRLGDAIAQLV